MGSDKRIRKRIKKVTWANRMSSNKLPLCQYAFIQANVTYLQPITAHVFIRVMKTANHSQRRVTSVTSMVYSIHFDVNHKWKERVPQIKTSWLLDFSSAVQIWRWQRTLTIISHHNTVPQDCQKHDDDIKNKMQLTFFNLLPVCYIT